jgi:hypothetical protein
VSAHNEARDWIATEFGAREPVKLRPELVETADQRGAVAQEIRRAAEPIERTTRGKALRDRALLIALEDSAEAAAELLAEAEALGVEVIE